MNRYTKQQYLAWMAGLLLIFILQIIATNVDAQPNINRIEYYIDSDPGYGQATNLSFTGTNNATATITINLTPLSQGVHIVGVRSRDVNGAWSMDNKWIFLKPYTNAGAVPVPNINRVEWYMDTDPGYGNGTPISITPAANLNNLAIDIPLTPLTQGVHIVGVRSRDANGAWSLDNKWIFLKPYSNAGAVPQPKVVRVEYFIDTDPGYGNGTPVTITAATGISNLIFDADISVVPNGVHKLAIRSLDENGAWSLDNRIDFTGGTLSSNTYQWVGNTSTAWNNSANWSSGSVPTATNNVIIPANRPFNPVVANGVTANCKTITVNPGAAVTVATGGNLKVNK